MMFGTKKQLHEMEERLKSLEEKIGRLLEENEKHNEEVKLKVGELSKAANRHDMAVEDLIESWEELQEQNRDDKEKLSDALEAASAREREQAHEREKALLDIVIRSHDMLYGLQRAAEESNAEAWIRQFSMTDAKISEMRIPAGFQIVKDTGIPVDYAVHDIAEAAPASEKERDRTVKEIISYGYIYMGRVLRKAQVIAYKYTANAGDETDIR